MRTRTSISELVAKEHSRKNVDRIIRAIGDDQKQFVELMKVFLGKDK